MRTGLIKTILNVPHNPSMSFKSYSLYFGFFGRLETDLKFTKDTGYTLEIVLMISWLKP